MGLDYKAKNYVINIFFLGRVSLYRNDVSAIKPDQMFCKLVLSVSSDTFLRPTLACRGLDILASFLFSFTVFPAPGSRSSASRRPSSSSSKLHELASVCCFSVIDCHLRVKAPLVSKI